MNRGDNDKLVCNEVKANRARLRGGQGSGDNYQQDSLTMFGQILENSGWESQQS
jgi:hypothetical protein